MDLLDSAVASSLPMVSVIVPTFQRDFSLEKALLSIQNQTYDNVEIIVVDDNAETGWNKRVSCVIENLNQKHHRQISCVVNSTNKGSAESRNIGIWAASGDFITFLDDDDVYLPGKVSKQIENMVENKSDFCITDIALYYDNGKLCEKRSRDYIKQFDNEHLHEYHLLHNMTGTDTLMFRKSYLIKIGCFPPHRYGDEFYLMNRAIEAGGSFSYLPACDVNAFVHLDVDGLSSGDSKIDGEMEIYAFKKKYFSLLKKKNIRYIKMRHFAVLSFAEMRRKRFIPFISHAFRAFCSSPISCLQLIAERR